MGFLYSGYGSCVYPSSPSTEGGSVAPGGTSVPGTTPATGVTQPPPPGTTTAPLYGGGGITPEIGSTDPDSPKSNASPDLLIRVILFPVIQVLLLGYHSHSLLMIANSMFITEDKV
ncbi:Hypothetical predicted protein [Olea europaea subsp. europaea]|uniref:Uncharacterized protein n=1 Tax=Olea europaea subsp. europaea TaxID=158383 RepID=A0A8S0VGR4_OLEEU|nr:Hypothetical predicted protein [Olea europaea subsp. europaea]